MRTSADIERRLKVVHNWVKFHCRNSQSPNRYLARYEEALSVVMREQDDDVRSGWTDPVRVAAEIEAHAAWRAVHDWCGKKGRVV